MQYGRKIIYTDVEEVNETNILSILQDALPVHEENAEDYRELVKYEKGDVDNPRQKLTRPEIDNWVFENLPHEITNFWTGFGWANPITLVQSSTNKDEDIEKADAITLLNKYYNVQNIKTKTQQLGRDVVISSMGYTFVWINTDWQYGDSPFTIDVLSPEYTFVVRSNYYPDHRIVLGVTYREDNEGNQFFTCFTKDRRYEVVKSSSTNSDGDEFGEIEKNEMNAIKMIPIVEWIYDYDRMGAFEREIDEIVGIGMLVSDFLNDTEQNTNAMFWGNDIDFPVDENGKEIRPGNGEWLLTQTTKDGTQPKIEPIVMDYNYSGIMDEITSRTNRVKERCNLPQRNDNSGGSTGIAMSDATGWTHSEIQAQKQDRIKDGSKMQEIRCVLSACRENANAEVDENLLNLMPIDIETSFKRQKNYEMVTKINTYATGVSHGLDPKHMADTINLFDDPQQVAEDSKPYTDRYLASVFGENSNNTGDTETAPNAEGDISDQIGNSSNIDGIRIGQEV